jgi:hypothetical protein
VGVIYNLCTEHQSLRLPGLICGHKWLGRTQAMAAAIMDHCWCVSELLSYHVVPSHWQPPKRRGRASQATKQLVTRRCGFEAAGSRRKASRNSARSRVIVWIKSIYAVVYFFDSFCSSAPDNFTRNLSGTSRAISLCKKRDRHEATDPRLE